MAKHGWYCWYWKCNNLNVVYAPLQFSVIAFTSLGVCLHTGLCMTSDCLTVSVGTSLSLLSIRLTLYHISMAWTPWSRGSEFWLHICEACKLQLLSHCPAEPVSISESNHMEAAEFILLVNSRLQQWPNLPSALASVPALTNLNGGACDYDFIKIPIRWFRTLATLSGLDTKHNRQNIHMSRGLVRSTSVLFLSICSSASVPSVL